ncbi:MAG: heme-binding protein, partial [Thiogranum sp.]
AVGVSGAPSGKTDEECAQAGIDEVIDDLEMM